MDETHGAAIVSFMSCAKRFMDYLVNGSRRSSLRRQNHRAGFAAFDEVFVSCGRVHQWREFEVEALRWCGALRRILALAEQTTPLKPPSDLQACRP